MIHRVHAIPIPQSAIISKTYQIKKKEELKMTASSENYSPFKDQAVYQRMQLESKCGSKNWRYPSTHILQQEIGARA